MMKVAIIAIFGITLFCEIRAIIDPCCTRKGLNGNCGFYQCFEKIRQCGSPGYLIGYGYKYCMKFKTCYNSFTQSGKNWIDCVRPCLTRKLIGKYMEYAGAGQHCEELQTFAFDTHVSCYLNCGFCSIYSSNVAALNQCYDTLDLLSSQAAQQILKVAASCLG